jgi:outer membrane protein assembly factor BamE (lipoprotein component of BamABCDE complex)
MKKIFCAFLTLFLLLLNGCFKPIVRGYNFSKNMENENKIKVGMLKEEVFGIMSYPSFQTKDAFYYYSSVNKQHPFLHERTLSQKIMIIEFNQNWEVRKINILQTQNEQKK